MLEFICDDILNIIIGNLSADEIAQLRFSYINTRKFTFLRRLDGILVQNGFDLYDLYHTDYVEPTDDDDVDDDFHLWEGDYDMDDDEEDYDPVYYWEDKY